MSVCTDVDPVKLLNCELARLITSRDDPDALSDPIQFVVDQGHKEWKAAEYKEFLLLIHPDKKRCSKSGKGDVYETCRNIMTAVQALRSQGVDFKTSERVLEKAKAAIAQGRNPDTRWNDALVVYGSPEETVDNKEIVPFVRTSDSISRVHTEPGAVVAPSSYMEKRKGFARLKAELAGDDKGGKSFCGNVMECGFGRDGKVKSYRSNTEEMAWCDTNDVCETRHIGGGYNHCRFKDGEREVARAHGLVGARSTFDPYEGEL
ncbi:hypothetical protein CYMTET_47775 [Cymbomonas tetramitiformis]|uniref:Uncharacterized protein n=1 Tax=Cymbomonas tetramitiformis TaxID=36881 RepID=A0AAE0EVW4_9CHLO|nr:hypothetical protein CYMTET_47775 [Cymbomonas tetramitiformis]|eukprot:gene9910-11736_t